MAVTRPRGAEDDIVDPFAGEQAERALVQRHDRVPWSMGRRRHRVRMQPHLHAEKCQLCFASVNFEVNSGRFWRAADQQVVALCPRPFEELDVADVEAVEGPVDIYHALGLADGPHPVGERGNPRARRQQRRRHCHWRRALIRIRRHHPGGWTDGLQQPADEGRGGDALGPLDHPEPVGCDHLHRALLSCLRADASPHIVNDDAAALWLCHTWC